MVGVWGELLLLCTLLLISSAVDEPLFDIKIGSGAVTILVTKKIFGLRMKRYVDNNSQVYMREGERSHTYSAV